MWKAYETNGINPDDLKLSAVLHMKEHSDITDTLKLMSKLSYNNDSELSKSTNYLRNIIKTGKF